MTRRDGLVRDKDGDLIAPRPAARRPRTECSCRRGWLGPEDAPTPCPVCRPDTYARLLRRSGGCTVCGRPLHPVILADGFTTHPGCDALAGPDA